MDGGKERERAGEERQRGGGKRERKRESEKEGDRE